MQDYQPFSWNIVDVHSFSTDPDWFIKQIFLPQIDVTNTMPLYECNTVSKFAVGHLLFDPEAVDHAPALKDKVKCLLSKLQEEDEEDDDNNAAMRDGLTAPEQPLFWEANVAENVSVVRQRTNPMINNTIADLTEPLLPIEEVEPPVDGDFSPPWAPSRNRTWFSPIFGNRQTAIAPASGSHDGLETMQAAVKVDPKAFFANERTLLQWLNMAVLISTISISLMNFGNSLAYSAGVIMAPVAVVFLVYPFLNYHQRAQALLNRRESSAFTDRTLPTLLVTVVVFALIIITVLNLYYRTPTALIGHSHLGPSSKS
eukprot:Platyproteum_vivax@DN3247_c0_g1_i1.p2